MVQIQRLVTIPAFSHALSHRLRVALNVRGSLRGSLSHFVGTGVWRGASSREQQQNDGESTDYFHLPTMQARYERLVYRSRIVRSPVKTSVNLPSDCDAEIELQPSTIQSAP